MKKISILLTVFALIVCGCSKEKSTSLLSINDETGVVSFIATFEGASDPNTKLSLNTDDGVLSWKDGDKIAVQLTDDTFVPFTFGYSSTNSRYEFTATLGDKKIKDGGYAYYPASIAINGTPGSVRLPNTYNAEYTTVSTNTFATVQCPMMGTVHLGDEIINLKHLGGILSVTFDYVPADAESLVLTASGKGISGDFVVSSSQISAGAVVEANNTISLAFKAGTFGTNETEFFIPVPVTTFSGGFTVEFKNGATTPETLYTKSTDTKTTAISVARASIKQMSKLTVPKYVYVRNATTWDGTIYAHLWGKNKSNEEVNLGGWTATPLSSCSSFTHGGETYYRLSLPTGITGNANLIIHANDDFKRTDNHASVPSIPITQDSYLTAEDFTPTTIRVYMIDQSKWTNGTVDAWYDGGSTIVGASINSLSESSKNGTQYRYFDANSKTTLKIEFKANWDGEYSGGQLTHSNVSKDLVYYWKGRDNDDKGNWYYLSEYSIAKVTIDSAE